MTVPTDPFLFVNGVTADAAQVNARYAPLYAALSGALDTDNLLDVINEKLGLTKGAITRRGKSMIATTESRTNTAYGTLPTPDQVTGIVLPTDGLISVAYQALWQESVNGAASAAIFVGANQVKIQDFTAPSVQAAGVAADAALWAPLTTQPAGLGGPNLTVGAPGWASDVTTGQLVGSMSAGPAGVASGGPCYIFAAAGTYTIGVQFKSTSGSVTVKNRKLWVWTTGF